MQEEIDTLVMGWFVVTMNPKREIIRDGAVAIHGNTIVDVGKTAELLQRYEPRESVGGPRFVITPGLINTHIHITGEPLTRGFVPDNTSFKENVFDWLRPLYALHTETDEYLSAQLAAVEMLKTGTTTFLEAGTIHHVAAVVRALEGVGIRARFGKRVWDLPPEPEVYKQSTDEAIEGLNATLDTYLSLANGRLGAWSMLVGHTTCSDELWKAAREAADHFKVGMNFHMSPASLDPEGFVAKFGHRPLVHLNELDVLRDDTSITHCVHVDEDEIGILAQCSCSVEHCPTTALKVAYGVTQIGRMPEMLRRGINVSIGTDGNNASNYSDMYRATYLVAGLFKDARRDATILSAEDAFEMATIGGARTMLMQNEIGSLEIGKKADLVLHDTDRPEWRPLLNVVNQLVWSSDGRSVHTVFVDGVKVVDAGHVVTLDEEQLYARCQVAGEALALRSALSPNCRFPVV